MRHVVTSHQPELFLRTHLLRRAFEAEVYVVGDHDQWSRWSKFHELRMADRQGKEVRSTVSVKKGDGTKIPEFYEVELSYAPDWTTKLLTTWRMLYGKAKFYEEVDALIRPIIEAKPRMYLELSEQLTQAAWDYFGVPARRIMESSLGLTSRGWRREAEMGHRLGAQYNLTGQLSWDAFLKDGEALLKEYGTTVIAQHWKAPKYAWGREGQSHGWVDLAAHCGREGGRAVLMDRTNEQNVFVCKARQEIVMPWSDSR
jgi:hypothetical protein